MLRSKTSFTKYNPIKRPWYGIAIKNDNITKTKPYLFANLQSLGITYAKRIEHSNNVIGIDLSLRSLSAF